MAKLFANSGDPDLGLHCLPVTLLQISRLQWVKGMNKISGETVKIVLLFYLPTEK